MRRLNQDTLLAIFLLLVSGGLMVASFSIREPDYGQLSPAAWPRAVVIALAILSFLYLIQSLAGTPAGVDLPETGDRTGAPGGNPSPAGGGGSELDGRATSPVEQVKPAGAAGFWGYWRNVIWCFLLFLGYLLALPVVGMLIGGVTFAFLLMTALGGWAPRQLALHAVVAIVAVGGMWALFTFGLKVPLPAGMILPRF